MGYDVEAPAGSAYCCARAPLVKGHAPTTVARGTGRPTAAVVRHRQYEAEMASNLPGFETRAAAVAEDLVRAELMAATIAEERARLASLGTKGRRRVTFAFDLHPAETLAQRLREGAQSGVPPITLASKAYMREVRISTIGSLVAMVAHIPDEDLRVVTVLNERWRLTATQPMATGAYTIKREFRQHLTRAGALSVEDGLLVGFLHGEHEPTHGHFPLHYHLVTTAAQANLLKTGLSPNLGYVPTLSGAVPVKVQHIKQRLKQLSYLLKGEWLQKALREVAGEWKRDREPHRIEGLFHTIYLMWLDQHTASQQHSNPLIDLMVISGCNYRGGTFSSKRPR